MRRSCREILSSAASMRTKLLTLASLLAGSTGAALCALIAYYTRLDLLAFTALFVTTLIACVFVYRHTARRRALQALITALGATLVGWIVLYAIYYFVTEPRDGMPYRAPTIFALPRIVE